MTYDVHTPILKQLRVPCAPLSKRPTGAIGILKGRRGERAQKEIREMRLEWAKREKRQVMLARRSRE